MEVDIYIKEQISEVLKKLYSITLKPSDVHLEQPDDAQWGDYATNVAMTISEDVKQSPLDIAKSIVYELQSNDHFVSEDTSNVEIFQKIDIQGPGFINFKLTAPFYLYDLVEKSTKSVKKSPRNTLSGKKVLVEHTDPNPFKIFHIGHLMTNAIGESLSRILAFNGAEVKRANYQGDVGMHVAKAIWGILKLLEVEGKKFSDLASLSLEDRTNYLGKGYALGSKSLSEDDSVEAEMASLNMQIYVVAQEALQEEMGWKPLIDYSALNTGKSPFDISLIKEIYVSGRKWSLEYFETLYKMLGSKFDMYLFESFIGEYGLKIVREMLKKGIFEKDQGAVIFKGEKYGLHTRVFMNSMGLPVYEAKDLGLAVYKNEQFAYDQSLIITGNEVNDYFNVVLKALEQVYPELASKTLHLGHGMMRFKEGKMSSRTGDVVSGETLLREAQDAISARMEESVVTSELTEDQEKQVVEDLAVGAVKYGILKYGLGKDIVYDKEGIVAISGNTGPYIQYAFARASSILQQKDGTEFDFETFIYDSVEDLTPSELSLLRIIQTFFLTAEYASEKLSPSIVCDYLHKLASAFNTFYNDVPVLSETNEQLRGFRLVLVQVTSDILEQGLSIIGIRAPQRV